MLVAENSGSEQRVVGGSKVAGFKKSTTIIFFYLIFFSVVGVRNHLNCVGGRGGGR